MVTFCTTNEHGYGVKFSPFNCNLIAVASSKQFGISGSGTLYILYVSPSGTIQEIGQHKWVNGLFDVCWSESNANHILTASADGSIQIWAFDVNEPIVTFLSHSKEVSCIDSTNYEVDHLLASASWDGTVKIWNANQTTLLTTLMGHAGPVHEARFSPLIPNIIGSVSADKTLKLWSILSANHIASIQVHDADVLSCDWCKHDGNIIATSGSDSLIRCWDIRKQRQPLFQIKGGEEAIKQIRFSPHFSHILASASFDYSTKIWDVRQKDPLEVFQHHSEFVYGLDWNKNKICELADCSWDCTIQVFKSKVLQNLKNKI